METDPLWYKDAILYELHVRAFQDTARDGIGDFRGLRQRLDYLQDLGVTVLWLLPFYPSPLKDDGYDIADYTSVNPHYGTLRDFRDFLDAAHRRGLRVITELVINHTSDQHPWFQRARHAKPGSPERDFYVWSTTADKYKDARIIFKDFERSNWAWDPVADAYYWHRFYSHQPDLNFDNPAVWDALIPIMDFWLDMGVDGLRLDAIPYLFEREGTSCENLPETHVFLKHLRKHIDQKHPGRMFLAEANQWPEDAIPYFGNGDECHMAFHFPVMPRLFMALHQEDRFPIIDILEQTPPIPENCQWCMFLRNHDELTLEMVTDEERDYMYRAYAHDPQARINLGIRRRLAPLLRNDRRRIELMNALLFSLPGTPVIYYGDEIGMGDNIYLGDRNGVRTPMQWSGDRNAGFSKANPQRLYLPVIIDPEYHYEAINVDAQQQNSSSLLWWMKRLIALRKEHRAFGRGSIEFLRPANPKILAFIRRFEGERILVVANLSRFVQYVQLDLGEFKGYVLQELFGRSPFPAITAEPYFLTIGPHAFFWFAIGPAASRQPGGDTPRMAPVPRVVIEDRWEELLEPSRFDWLEPAIKSYFHENIIEFGKDRPLRDVRIQTAFHVPLTLPAAALLIDVDFLQGEKETRGVRLAFAEQDKASQMAPRAVIAQLVRHGNPAGILYDARTDPVFCAELLKAIAANRLIPFDGGDIVASHFPGFNASQREEEVPTPITVLSGEQHNLSIQFGNRWLLKSYERLEPGLHPDLELGRFLGERSNFRCTAPTVGTIEYRPTEGEPITLSVLFGFLPNEGDAWRYTLDALSRFFERALARPMARGVLAPLDAWTPGANASPPAEELELIDGFLQTVDDLGKRTAQMHLALASAMDLPALAPEPFTKLYQRSLYQAMRTATGMVMRDLRQRWGELPAETQVLAERALELEAPMLRRYRTILSSHVDGLRIRIHGNYTLSELLYTGSGFQVVDFEGDPSKPFSERRIKRSPLRDVASMIRSFQYAAFSPLYGVDSRHGTFPGHVRGADRETLIRWARYWCSWVTARLLSGYYAEMAGSKLLPSDPRVTRDVLELYVLEKAVLELDAELKNRPAWIPVPLAGLVDLMETPGGRI